ncbi:MAG: hypothetical protein JSV52_11625 [Candidatus Zixiibacteriota bacterium]|nr:MAG: hypothetical protein JSV52_11625 [candidate division Zixibacteria bacterium]
MKKGFTLIVLTIILTGAPVFAQGEFLKEGERGLGVAPQFLFGDNHTVSGVSAGYCLENSLELSFAYAHNSDPEADAFCPALTFYKKETRDRSMLGLALTVGLEMVSAGGNDNTAILVFGAGGFDNFYLNESIVLQPSIHGSFSFKLEGTEDRTLGILTGGLAMAFNHTKTVRPFVSTSIGITAEADSEIFFGLGFGIIVALQ